MNTQVLPVNDKSIALAAELLQKGELVALPTETVYGIAADARNGEAVKKIFEAKGRPQDNPLIVHIYGMEMLKGIVSEVPDRAYKLAKAFWPGPLTMVMPRGGEVSDVTCAGLDTVGVRMPSHPVVQAVIKASGVAFAAPSANLSGKPSPSNAQDTLVDMDGRLPLILDGGESAVGVESTVVAVTGEHPMLLRPGCEVHAYEPTPKDIIAIRNADVFIYVGGESDAWVQTVLDGVDNPDLRVVTLMDCVELLHEETVEGMQAERHGHDHDEEDEDEDEDEEELDEHVWTSPRNAARICQKLCDTFSAADSAHAAQYAQRCGDYVEQLDRLDAEFQDVVENAARKTMVFADRFPLRYFADAYGLDYYAAYPGCADAAEPSAATVAFLIDKVRAEGIPVVFTIELSNGKLADTICEATGAKKLEFATCHNVTAQAFANGATYLQLMERNVQALREALN